MHILIATNEKGQETFYGPFISGEEALDWAIDKFNEEYTLTAVYLCEPKNLKLDESRPMPKEPPPALKEKQQKMEKIKVSFEFEIDEDSELAQELDYLDTRKLISRIQEKISDYVSQQYRQYPCWLDDKNIKVHFNRLQRNREDIILSMCHTKRHDYGLEKGETSRYKTVVGGMTEEEKKSLWKEMAQLFDNDIAPYMDFK